MSLIPRGSHCGDILVRLGSIPVFVEVSGGYWFERVKSVVGGFKYKDFDRISSNKIEPIGPAIHNQVDLTGRRTDLLLWPYTIRYTWQAYLWGVPDGECQALEHAFILVNTYNIPPKTKKVRAYVEVNLVS
jgi:hypothetical protein